MKLFIDAYPHITKAGVYAALAFASDALRAYVVYPHKGEILQRES